MSTLFDFSINDLVRDGVLPLERSRLGRGTVRFISTCLESLYQSLFGGISGSISSGFTIEDGRLRFIGSVANPGFPEFAPGIETATTFLKLLFGAANHIGKRREAGIDPKIRWVQAAELRTELLDAEVILYSPRSINTALNRLLKFLVAMSFDEQGFANVWLGGNELRICVARPPRPAPHAHALKLVGRVTGTSDTAGACEIHAIGGRRARSYWLTRPEDLRDQIASFYTCRAHVEVDATMTVRNTKGHAIVGRVNAIREIAPNEPDLLADSQNHEVEHQVPARRRQRAPAGRQRRR